MKDRLRNLHNAMIIFHNDVKIIFFANIKNNQLLFKLQDDKFMIRKTGGGLQKTFVMILNLLGPG